MSLRSKIILILSVVVLLYAAADNASLRYMVGRSFATLEEEEAEKDLQRVIAGLANQEEDVDILCRSWAGWEATQDYLRNPDPAFIQAHFGTDLAHTDVDLLYFCDASGRVLWGRIEAPDSGERIRVREFPGEALNTSHPVMNARGGGEPVSGMLSTERGVMVVSAHPVLDGAEPLGRVIAGHFVDGGALEQRVTEQTGVSFDIFSERDIFAADDSSTLTQADRAYFDQVPTPGEAVFVEGDDDRLHVYTKLIDVKKSPALFLRADLDRNIAARGSQAVRYSMLTALSAALVILLVLLRVLQVVVIRPLTRLTDHALAIGRTDDTTVRLCLDREDELGLLANEFDSMMDKLARSREQVVGTARLAGMSEIATGVLHNVGNVLNSVNVSANIVRKKVAKLGIKDLQQMIKVLEKHADDLPGFFANDKRAKHFLPLMAEISATFTRQKDEVSSELSALAKGMDHIADLVRAQQSYAGTKGVFELADLGAQVDAAVHMCAQTSRGASDVEYSRDFEELSSVRVDKHKLMEILVNLIQNARQALKEAGREEKRITLRTLRLDDQTVRIEVEDNGIGIAPENLTEVFHHGFTTKQDGHGFGLHVSANAATEMGAHLSVFSDGPGHGATFRLDLPAPVPELADSAVLQA